MDGSNGFPSFDSLGKRYGGGSYVIKGGAQVPETTARKASAPPIMGQNTGNPAAALTVRITPLPPTAPVLQMNSSPQFRSRDGFSVPVGQQLTNRRVSVLSPNRAGLTISQSSGDVPSIGRSLSQTSPYGSGTTFSITTTPRPGSSSLHHSGSSSNARERPSPQIQISFSPNNRDYSPAGRPPHWSSTTLKTSSTMHGGDYYATLKEFQNCRLQEITDVLRQTTDERNTILNDIQVLESHLAHEKDQQLSLRSTDGQEAHLNQLRQSTRELEADNNALWKECQLYEKGFAQQVSKGAARTNAKPTAAAQSAGESPVKMASGHAGVLPNCSTVVSPIDVYGPPAQHKGLQSDPGSTFRKGVLSRFSLQQAKHRDNSRVTSNTSLVRNDSTDEQWACSACTYLNAAVLFKCEMCDMPRLKVRKGKKKRCTHTNFRCYCCDDEIFDSSWTYVDQERLSHIEVEHSDQ